MSLVFNIKDLKELLVNFYTLTNIRIVVFDDLFCEIASYPTKHTDYCSLIRSIDELDEKCKLCDKKACLESKQDFKIHIYQCHAGLTEAVVPIRYDNLVIGYFMFGQIIQSDDREGLWKKIEKDFINTGINLEKIKRCFFSKKLISNEVIHAAARIVETNAAYLYLSRKLILEKNTLVSKIENYINEHISDDLSAPRLCSRFNISKSKLYEISNVNYGTGIAAYIKNLRIQKAKRLLKNTNLSVYNVAREVGINDYNYFTKQFKTVEGITPRNYRKQIHQIRINNI